MTSAHRIVAALGALATLAGVVAAPAVEPGYGLAALALAALVIGGLTVAVVVIAGPGEPLTALARLRTRAGQAVFVPSEQPDAQGRPRPRAPAK
jgi:hypothetical protein